MIDLLNNRQNVQAIPTTKKQAFEQANINSLFHIEEYTDTIKASLYMAPINWPDKTIDYISFKLKGRNRMATVRQGRLKRARSLLRNKQAFMLAMWHNIRLLERKARESHKRLEIHIPENVSKVIHGSVVDNPIAAQEHSVMALHDHYPSVSFKTYL